AALRAGVADFDVSDHDRDNLDMQPNMFLEWRRREYRLHPAQGDSLRARYSFGGPPRFPGASSCSNNWNSTPPEARGCTNISFQSQLTRGPPNGSTPCARSPSAALSASAT